MYKRFFAVCIAVFLAVQTVFSVFADINCRMVIDEITDSTINTDWGLFLYGRMYSDRQKAVEKVNEIRENAAELMNESGFVRPTEFQRAAIVLSAFGVYDESLMKRAVYQNIELDRQGLNAYIWAIIAANCTGNYGDNDGAVKFADIVDFLLSKQLSDGGFNLAGSGADTDITAAAVYALAPLCGSDEKIRIAVEKAVKALIGLQQEDGGFYSMGTANCESTAQAIIAFCAVGMGNDECTKNAVNKLYEYKVDGGFSHLENGKVNVMATVQAGFALAATELAKSGKQLFCNCIEDYKSGFFCYDNLPYQESTEKTTSGTSVATTPNSLTSTDSTATTPESIPDAPATTPLTSEAEITTIPESNSHTDVTAPQSSETEITTIPESNSQSDAATTQSSETEITAVTTPPITSGVMEIIPESSDGVNYSEFSGEYSAENSGKSGNLLLPLLLILICVSAAGFLSLAYKKGNKISRYIPVATVIFIALIAIILLIFTGNENEENSPANSDDKASEYGISSGISENAVYCEFKINSEKANGEIIFDGKTEIFDGNSVYDVLCKICKENNIQMESSYTPAFDSYYIEGINNIYEMDYGAGSGWIYRVNGEIPNIGCSGYKLKENDKVEFIYTLTLGQDIGG